MTRWTFAVVNLTLIDLPGLTKVAVGTQQIDMSFLSMVLRLFSLLIVFMMYKKIIDNFA